MDFQNLAYFTSFNISHLFFCSSYGGAAELRAEGPPAVGRNIWRMTRAAFSVASA
jgi:hypothetical protein